MLEKNELSKLTRPDTLSNTSNGAACMLLGDSESVIIGGTMLWKYNSNACLIWNYEPASGKGYSSIFFTEKKEVLSSGQFANNSFLIRKYSAEGDSLWEIRYKPTGTIFAKWEDAVIDKNYNIITTGFMNKPGLGSYYDWVTVKYSSNGDLLWAKRYEKGEDNVCYAMAVDDSNYVYVTGAASFSNVTDLLTIKYSPDGDIIWEKYFDGGFGGDRGFDIETDKYGRI